MADTMNPTPFATGDAGAPPDVPSQKETAGLADTWRNWMSDPHNRAAMIQFGLTLSQPIAAGQNRMGQIGQAIGAGAEASEGVTAAEQRQQELGSKQELRSAQADVAEARAGAAGARAGVAGERANLALERLQLAQYIADVRKTQGDFSAKLKAQDVWRKLKQAADLSGNPADDPGDFNAWYASMLGSSPTGGSVAPAGAPKVGDVIKGYRFKGGDPGSPSSWDKVQ